MPSYTIIGTPLSSVTGLSVGYSELALEVARYLGLAQTSTAYTALTTDEKASIDSIVQSGYRQFLWPPPLMVPDKAGHQKAQLIRWSFLSPKADLSVSSGDGDYDLPADFGGNARDFTFSVGAGSADLTVVDEQHMRAMRAYSNSGGAPEYVAIRPKSADGTVAQRWEVLFHPLPNASYTISYRYDVAPPSLSDSVVYPYGGPAHAETLLESCLAVAEERKNDASTLHRARFQTLLAASVQHDAAMMGEDAQNDTWPVGDAGATTLDVTYDLLLKRMGNELQVGWDYNLWSIEDRRKVDMLIHQGLRTFLSPPPLPRERFAHEWSFLRPVTTITTAADTSVYGLPSDFAAMDGPFTFAPDDNVLWRAIEMVGEHQIRLMLSEDTATSRPRFAAIRPRPYTGAQKTSYEIIFYPTPDAAYTLTYRYRVNIAALSSSKPYPPGAQPHAETILEACLAAAERFRDGKDGVHTGRFQEMLMASVSADRRASCPDFLGYNRDGSDGYMEGHPRDYHYMSDNTVTYNGVLY